MKYSTHPAVHTQALNAVSTETEAILSELSKLWRMPDLSADDASARAEVVLAKLSPIVECERGWLQKSKDELSKAWEKVTKLAHEVGEQVLKAEKVCISEQYATIKIEEERLLAIRHRQAEKVKELQARVSRECKRLGVQESEYALDLPMVGASALRAANQQLQKLDALMQQRVDVALAQRARIRRLADKLGDDLEFRLALDGELAGGDGGVVVLEKNADNEIFVREFVEFREASTKDVSLFTRCVAHLDRLRETYEEEISRRKTRNDSRSSSASRSCSRSRSRSGIRTKKQDQRAGRRREGKKNDSRNDCLENANGGPAGVATRPRQDQPPPAHLQEQQSGQPPTDAPPPSRVGWPLAGPPPGYGHPHAGHPPRWPSSYGEPPVRPTQPHHAVTFPGHQHPGYYGTPLFGHGIPPLPYGAPPQGCMHSVQYSSPPPDYASHSQLSPSPPPGSPPPGSGSTQPPPGMPGPPPDIGSCMTPCATAQPAQHVGSGQPALLYGGFGPPAPPAPDVGAWQLPAFHGGSSVPAPPPPGMPPPPLYGSQNSPPPRYPPPHGASPQAPFEYGVLPHGPGPPPSWHNSAFMRWLQHVNEFE
eukprot:TRINITY_DN6446_c0_g1_i1.p1 TRINITY_DN6446_c0_g1~~TRINITY_DN6446_c0_g1_i1.p1  ORF type:complete len:593 (+),score=66.17 TRINITY_DN6446_c0_g1_i1:143-1921(+)